MTDDGATSTPASTLHVQAFADEHPNHPNHPNHPSHSSHGPEQRAVGVASKKQTLTTKRLSADLPVEDADTLEQLTADTRSPSKLATLLRAIRTLQALVKAEQDGGKLTIDYPNGERHRLHFL